ncbi:hypothetical protein [Lacipirellula limnantheis]|uniref:Uncharacterized protein n=1 Tax=Lacipirellula limnantheis TaxID=2528024 RepID=A0A517TZL7_9BACT|nr:hypothetical protein [Lacipirellula limnantheis]QDT73827.1 hypothetical protein I41_30180 [Lacipirellula limnantheis]
MQSILRDPLFRRTLIATVGVGTLGSLLAGLAISVSLWAVLLAVIGALISLALGFLLAVSVLAHREVGAHRFWKCALQNYLFTLVLNALLAFSMAADHWVQFTYGLIGLAVLSPLIVGVNWFTHAATPKAA